MARSSSDNGLGNLRGPWLESPSDNGLAKGRGRRKEGGIREGCEEVWVGLCRGGGAYTRTKAFRVGCATPPRGPCRCYATRSHRMRVLRVIATNSSLLTWAKSIVPHVEEGAAGAAALVPRVNHGLRAVKRGERPKLVQIPIREKGKQMQVNILATGRIRARLERNEVSGDDFR